MEDKVIKNGIVGKLSGYRIHGKSYDALSNEVTEQHEEDCVCCREVLIKSYDNGN